MKRIGIATFFDDNFGTCLQAFSLQQLINKMGYSSEIIRYYRQTRTLQSESRWKKLFRYAPSKVLYYFANRALIEQKKAAFSAFRRDRMVFSEDTYYRDSDLSNLSGHYDALVCGSDMIWSEDFSADWSYLYLSFADKNKSISYAPSFGKNSLTEDNVRVCRPYINGIGALSCREEAGVDLIKRVFGLEAEHVIDPTLLLTQDEWRKAIDNDDRMVNDRYCLVYCFLGTQRGREKIFQQIEKREGLKLVFLSGADGHYSKYKYKGSVGPMEFVRMYRDAEFVVTDTFHGLLFALIFNKPFVVLAKEPFGVSADRQKSTLSTLGLQDRYISYDKIIDQRLLSLDYSIVNNQIEEMRKTSLGYLRQSLQQATNK